MFGIMIATREPGGSPVPCSTHRRQPTAGRARIAQRVVHEDEGVAVRELAERVLQQVGQRAVLRDVDVGGHARRVVLQPEALHVVPL